MQLPFKRIKGPNLSTIQKRGAVINYEPMILNDYKMFVDCWELAEKLKPDLIKNVKEEYDFLSDRHDWEELKEFKKSHPFWKKENDNLMCDYANLYHDLWWLQRDIINWKDKKRFSKNNVACNANTCLSYFQVYGDSLFVVSRSLDIACGFKADILTIKYIADKLECKDICWMIIAPHQYVENILDGEPQTYEDLLKMKPILKVRKEVE